MSDFLFNLLQQTVGTGGAGLLTGVAIGYFYAFTLVMFRMAGLMVIGPVFGHASLPMNVRVLLVVALSLLMTPIIFAETPSRTVAKYDVDGDSRLDIDEVPEKMQPRLIRIWEASPESIGDPLSSRQLAISLAMPNSLADYVWTAVGELSLGLVLGIGVTIILSSLQFAGHMIDQQSGTAVGEVFNPALDTSETITAQLLYWLGLTLFLIVGGHLKMVSALLDTYQAFPVGEGFVDKTAIELLHHLFMRSLGLSLQIAAPVLATMALVAVTMGFLGLSVPQINVLVVGFPIRATVSLLIVALTLIGAGDVLVDAIESTLEQLEYAIVGLPPEGFE